MRNQAEPLNHSIKGGVERVLDTWSLTFHHLCPETLKPSGAWSSSNLSVACSAPGLSRSACIYRDVSGWSVAL